MHNKTENLQNNLHIEPVQSSFQLKRVSGEPVDKVNQPSVIILDEKSSFIDTNNPILGNDLENSLNKNALSTAYGSQKIEIDSTSKPENQPLYKHWHNYDSQNYPRFIEKSRHLVQKPAEFKSTKEISGTYLDINANKFLELKFDSSAVNPDYINKEPSKNLPVENNSQNSPSKRIVNEGKVAAGTPLAEHRKWCLTCDAEVTKKSCGHQNLITQTNVKEFPCPTCSRVFNNRSHLKRHNMIHSGEKPWPCSYCDKRFNRKSHLTRHLLTHTGEKPFK